VVGSTILFGSLEHSVRVVSRSLVSTHARTHARKPEGAREPIGVAQVVVFALNLCS